MTKEKAKELPPMLSKVKRTPRPREEKGKDSKGRARVVKVRDKRRSSRKA